MRQKEQKLKSCSWPFFIRAKWSVRVYVCIGHTASILKAQKNMFHPSLKGNYKISLSDCLQKFERVREIDNTEFDAQFDYQSESTQFQLLSAKSLQTI